MKLRRNRSAHVEVGLSYSLVNVQLKLYCCCAELSIKPELNDHLIPMHVQTGEPDMPDLDELNISGEGLTASSPTRETPANTSFSNKLRHGFSKASKRISGIMKTPMKSMKRTTSTGGTEDTSHVDGAVPEADEHTDEHLEDSALNDHLDEPNDATLDAEPTFDETADTSVVEEFQTTAVTKKKKKKKKPKVVEPPPEDDEDEPVAEVQEEEPQSFAEAPVGFEVDVDDGVMSFDRSGEMSMSMNDDDTQEETAVNGEDGEFQETIVVTKVTKTRKTHRKRTKKPVEEDEEPEVTDDL